MKKFLTIIFGVLFSIPAFATLPQAAINAGYTELEYIESTGTQYIDTGLKGTNDTVLETEIAFSNTANQMLWAYNSNAGGNTDRISVYLSNGGRCNFGDTSTDAYLPNYITVGTFATIKQDNTGIYVDGTKRVNYNATNTFTSVGNMYFLWANGTGAVPTSGKVKWFKITRGGNVVMNLVPVKKTVNGTDVYGMYNVLDNNPATAFYGNAGTGAFTGGPEVCPNGGTLQTYVSATGTVVQNGTPTPTNPITPTFYTQGNMVLRKVGDIADSYDASTGKITRRIGVKVFDGTEEFTYTSSTNVINSAMFTDRRLGKDQMVSTHFEYSTSNTSNIQYDKFSGASTTNNVFFKKQDITSVESWKQWLAEQYAAGTPVIVYYPLATETTEDWTEESYCRSDIKIATRAYNTTQFAPVVSALNTAIDTIKDVVTNTINQTAAVSALQSTKQTRPNDACPQYKQCLLVETEDGTPQWFVITDPFRDLFSPVIANNIAATGTSNLIDGYTQVEYIESTGTQYIDTGLMVGLTDKIKTNITFTSVATGDNFAFGARNNSAHVVLLDLWGKSDGSSTWYVRFGAPTSVNISAGNIIGQNLNIELDNQTFKVNGATVLTLQNDDAVPAYALTLFAARGANLSMFGYVSMKMYSFSIEDSNGNFIQNLVPARRNSDNVVGMYDTVSGTFFENAGTGDFVAGDPVANDADVPAATSWSITFGANDTYGYGRSIVYGTAKCNATSGSANDVATSTQMSANNWTATGSNCWCYAERVNETSSGSTGTSANRWVYLTVPSGETCAANCVENCADAVASGAAADKPFRQALVGL